MRPSPYKLQTAACWVSGASGRCVFHKEKRAEQWKWPSYPCPHLAERRSEVQGATRFTWGRTAAVTGQRPVCHAANLQQKCFCLRTRRRQRSWPSARLFNLKKGGLRTKQGGVNVPCFPLIFSHGFDTDKTDSPFVTGITKPRLKRRQIRLLISCKVPVSQHAVSGTPWLEPDFFKS